MYYNINLLPDELKRIIFDYIPLTVKQILNKKNYIAIFDIHYNYLKKCICNGIYRRFSFNTYIERLIKKDCDFIFKLMVKKEIFIWGKKKRYKYKGKNYKNYILFLKYLCIKN